MRKLRNTLFACSLISSISFGFLVASHGAEIVWRKSYGEAAAESVKTQKPMLVQFKAGWCQSCERMTKMTLAESHVAEYVNESFIPLIIDADESPDLVSSFNVESLPASVVVAPNLKILGRWEGFRSVYEFMRGMTQLRPRQMEMPVNVPL